MTEREADKSPRFTAYVVDSTMRRLNCEVVHASEYDRIVRELAEAKNKLWHMEAELNGARGLSTARPSTAAQFAPDAPEEFQLAVDEARRVADDDAFVVGDTKSNNKWRQREHRIARALVALFDQAALSPLAAPSDEACKIARDHLNWPELALSKRQTGVLAKAVAMASMEHSVAALSSTEPLTKEQIEDWRKKITNKIFSDFCGEPNEAHGNELQKAFGTLCDMAISSLSARLRTVQHFPLTEVAVKNLADWMNDGDGGLQEVTLHVDAEGGLSVSITDYPEEGAMPLFDAPTDDRDKE